MQVRLERVEQLGPRHPDSLSSALVVAGEAIVTSSTEFSVTDVSPSAADTKNVKSGSKVAE